MFWRNTGEDWVSPIVILLSYIESLIAEIPLVYPTLSYPELDPSILAGLRRVHPLLHDLETQVPASIRTRFKTWVQLVKQFSEGERSMVQMMEIKDERVRSKLALHWWSCEFTLTKGKKTRAQCSNRGVMMACGRCQSVRYCSEGHQKLDWKNHKRLCFEPTW